MNKKDAILFLTGAAIYPTLEIAWRGYTHISMAAAGGLCLCLIDRICNEKMKRCRLIPKMLAGAGIITGVEFFFGVTVNLILKLNVWDYTGQPGNILGQVCLPFALLWAGASIPAMGYGKLLNRSAFLAKSHA